MWKESFVDPLFKSGDKRDVSCYRGISIKAAITKLFEKMVCDSITPVVRPVISDAQHGFVWPLMATQLSVIQSNLRISSSAKSRMGGKLTACTRTFPMLSTGCFTVC
jgi:hypothetical protein